MILLTDKKDVINSREYVVLPVDETKDLYVSQRVYQDATILQDRFNNDVDNLISFLGIGGKQLKAVDYFYDNMPEPVHMLSAFFGMVSEEVELKLDLELLCNILFEMSLLIDFKNIVNIPASARKEVVITSRMLDNIKERQDEYFRRVELCRFDITEQTVEAVKQFFDSLGLSDMLTSKVSYVQAVNVETPMVASTLPIIEEETVEDPFALLDRLFDEAVSSMDEPEVEEQEVVEEEVHTEEVEEVLTEAEKEKRQIDALMARFGGAV